MKCGVWIRRLASRLLAVMALIVLLAVVYFFAIRPSQLRWGATEQEAARAMPGDELVPVPSFRATRAITIQGTPQEIWPWLAQMGYNRAGFYGYDLIENVGARTGMRSADRILPELQHPKPGDVLPISSVASMYFGQIETGNYLIWRGATTPTDGCFTWALVPIDGTHTRLISRIRLRYHWSSSRLLPLDIFTELADHVAVPRILRGIKGLVEGRPTPSLAEEAAEIAVWLLAVAEFAVALVLVFRWRRWGRAWFMGLAAGFLLQFVLYGHAPVWVGALLSCILCGWMLFVPRKEVGSSTPG
jgi:hypothetical protein